MSSTTSFYATESTAFRKDGDRRTVVHIFPDETKRDAFVGKAPKWAKNTLRGLYIIREEIDEETAYGLIAEIESNLRMQGGVVTHKYSEPSSNQSKPKRKLASHQPGDASLMLSRYPFLKSNLDFPENEEVVLERLQCNSTMVLSWLCDSCGDTFSEAVRVQVRVIRDNGGMGGCVTCPECRDRQAGGFKDGEL